jgi:SPP1 family predicted phage head-tail adaptor
MFGNVIQRYTPFLFAGRLRHRIEIINRSSSQDSTGGTNIDAGTTFATVWASVEPLNGTDAAAAGSFVSQVSHQVVVRYLAGVNSSMVVSFEGRFFQIVSVLNPIERKKMLVLLCKEINDSLQQST